MNEKPDIVDFNGKSDAAQSVTAIINDEKSCLLFHKRIRE
jgi:hypothetical protein